jgi:peptidoglycan/xylan/chitin deacetylase (PgdA/CDA1 family)
LIAIPRLIEQFARRELRRTFFVPYWVIEEYPAQIDLLPKNGHEVALHGYLHERSNEISKDDELYWLGRGLDAYRKHLGARPRGWRAPSFAFSKYPLRYLLEAGFEYDSSLMGDDIPYALKDGNASLLEFPVDWTLDDFPHYAHTAISIPNADNLTATRDGGLPQRVRRGLGIWRAVDLGLAPGTVGPTRPVQGGIGIARLSACQRAASGSHVSTRSATTCIS